MNYYLSKLSFASAMLVRQSTHCKNLLNTSFIPCLFKNDNLFFNAKYRFSNKKEEIGRANLKLFQNFVTDQTVLSKLKISGLHHVFPIQEQSFNYILDGRDVVASDRVGTGKTLAYTLPAFQKFKKAGYVPKDIKIPKFLVLCPTRQIALQITTQITKFNPGYKIVTVYGGEAIQPQISNIEKGAAIVVATPERLIDLIDRKCIQLDELEIVCLDEADTMIEKDFKQDIEKIYQKIVMYAGKTQNIMFSANFPPWVVKIANEYFTNLKRIDLVKDNQEKNLRKVNHFALLVKQYEKPQMVTQLIQKYNPENRTIIFAKTKQEMNDFLNSFDKSKTIVLHGDSYQATKQHSIDQFRKNDKKILITTNMILRGLEVPEVELIIHLSPPENCPTYIHHIERVKKYGLAITFIDQYNITQLLQTQKQANLKIKIMNNSFNSSLWKNQITKLVDRVTETKSSPEHTIYQIFAEEILKSANPQEAITALLKQKLGKAPKTTSVLTSEKAYISYRYNSGLKQPSDLQQQFPNVQISNIRNEANGMKFDIRAEDCFKFEHIIDELNLDIELIEENNNVSLGQYYQNLMKNTGSRGNQRHFGDTNPTKRIWSKQNLQKSDKYNKNIMRNHQKHREIINTGPKAFKYFLYGFSQDIKEQEMEEQIRTQANIDDLDVKIIIKNSDMGDKKVFGFLTLKNQDDFDKFMNCHINIDGFILKKKVSTDS